MPPLVTLVKPYQFGLATISGFRDHSSVPRLQTNRNQLVNIYLIKLNSSGLVQVFPGPGMTQNMDMTVMDKIFISKSIMNFKKWY